jgi:hypothetical protein
MRDDEAVEVTVDVDGSDRLKIGASCGTVIRGKSGGPADRASGWDGGSEGGSVSGMARIPAVTVRIVISFCRTGGALIERVGSCIMSSVGLRAPEESERV